jgi:hypothetical protein
MPFNRVPRRIGSHNRRDGQKLVPDNKERFMDDLEMEELRLEIKNKIPELYTKILKLSDDYSTLKELEDWLGLEPYMWDYRQFCQYCTNSN